MVNVQFLVIAYIVGMFVDWIFQSQWQAINKSKWGKEDKKFKSFCAVLGHSLDYAILTSLITLFLINDLSLEHAGLVFTILFISHMIIDTRIVVKWIMKLKGLTSEQITDYQNYGFMHIGIDHRLHEAVLLILAIIL